MIIFFHTSNHGKFLHIYLGTRFCFLRFLQIFMAKKLFNLLTKAHENPKGDQLAIFVRDDEEQAQAPTADPQ